EKMLAANGMKETGLSVRSFRLSGSRRILQREIDGAEIGGSQALLRNRFLDPGCRLFDGEGIKNRHASDQTAQSNLGIAIGADKFQRILRLTEMGSHGVGVHDVGYVGFGNQAQEQSHIKTHGQLMER